MKREIQSWWSPSVGREMNVACYGHFGKPVVLFPTGGADFLDVERFQLVGSLQPLIDAGRIKLYAIDSVDRQSWTAPHVPPREKGRMATRYDRYLVDELVPFVRWHCGGTDQRFAVCGASIGAFNALNVACKHPDLFDLTIGMSGTYQMDRRMHGHWDEDYYFNQPTQFVPNLPEGPQLDALRRARFVFGLGEAHENPDYTWRAAHALGGRGVWNRVEIWRDGHGHDWPTWREMLPRFLGAFA